MGKNKHVSIIVKNSYDLLTFLALYDNYIQLIKLKNFYELEDILEEDIYE